MRRKKIKYYALRVIDIDTHEVRWVAYDKNHRPKPHYLVDDMHDAYLYPDNIPVGHGTPSEWAEMLSETYDWKIVRPTGTTLTPTNIN